MASVLRPAKTLVFHSGYFYSASSSPLGYYYTQRRSRHSMYAVQEFHAEAPASRLVFQATASEGLAQGSYVAARAGVEPMTLRTKDVDSTNAPPTPHTLLYRIFVQIFNTLLTSLNECMQLHA